MIKAKEGKLTTIESQKSLEKVKKHHIFPSGFIINVTKKIEYNTDLDTNIVLTLCNNNKPIKSLLFKLHLLQHQVSLCKVALT